MNKDLVIHFYTNGFRGSITQAKSITQAIRMRNQIKDLEFSKEIFVSVSFTLLHSILLRGEERVRTVSEASKEQFGLFNDTTVYTEKWGKSYLRGFADKIETDELSDKNSLMIGKTLYGSTEEFRTVDTLKSAQSGLTQADIQNFYDMSEQIPSKVHIQASGFNNENFDHQGLGFLIQSMPGFERQSLNQVHLSVLNSQGFQNLHSEQLTIDNFQSIFKDLNEEIGYRVAEYEFKCNCSRDAMINFLKGLEVSKLSSMRTETQTITCNHCRERYEITPEEIHPLIK